MSALPNHPKFTDQWTQEMIEKLFQQVDQMPSHLDSWGPFPDPKDKPSDPVFCWKPPPWYKRAWRWIKRKVT